MFSIAAINDTDTNAQWEPLAPTKEAQEFYLSQKYHDGLLKLQCKDYEAARELLEAVLKDPLVSNTQIDNVGTDNHLRQLRFLTLKNLAAVLLQLGHQHFEGALRCYMQAVELDANDSVVWNQLGTLSCSMGLLSTSRWAFEQGLLCSPNNWNCMEKLMEVLIAIGDEVTCLSVADLILVHWPSHSRALHVKKTIEEEERKPFAPRGIDKLEPKHVRLKFPSKRVCLEDNVHNESSMKKRKSSVELKLMRVSWSAVVDGILSLLQPTTRESNQSSMNNSESTKMGGLNDAVVNPVYFMVDITLPDKHSATDSLEGREHSIRHGVDNTSFEAVKISPKDKDNNSSTDKEHSHERRSTRLERLRRRKSGRDESESSGKDATNSAIQLLDSFILKQPDGVISRGNSFTNMPTYAADMEYSNVMKFISGVANNSGPHHVAHLLLEELALVNAPFKDINAKILDLEKQTRNLVRDRNPLCSLFLAELCFDQVLCSANKSKCSELLSDSSFHLCKVIESVAYNFPSEFFSLEKCLDIFRSVSDVPVDSLNAGGEADGVFWARFCWLSGCLSVFSGCKEKAYAEFQIALSLLRTNGRSESGCARIVLPHCRIFRVLTDERILHEINLIKLDHLLCSNNAIATKVPAAEQISTLAPLLLFYRDAFSDALPCLQNRDKGINTAELSALDILISACEKSEQMNAKVCLESHRRKLQMLSVEAGMIWSSSSFKKDKLLPHGSNSVSEMEVTESGMSQTKMIVDAIKDISRSASKVKAIMDQNGTFDSDHDLHPLDCIVAYLQSLLLKIMHSAIKMILSRRNSSSGASNQEEHQVSCLVESVIAFCKLQHLDPSVSAKSQVELIVALHDLLAENGLCCAGRDSDGEEGMFLKFSINHLLALDVKLKSINSAHGVEEDALFQKNAQEDATPNRPLDCEEQEKAESEDEEVEEVQLAIDNALDQSFFCLYGLKINPDTSSEEDLAIHKNTNRGEYQTKEQCADVFRYLLPYAKALSRAGLVKLRRALRAIRKHFPQPPNEILINNAVDNYLDGSDSCEQKLCEIHEAGGSADSLCGVLFSSGKCYESFQKLRSSSSEPYLEVYGNLYYFIAQAEDTSATDKYPGFVLKKEGEEFVENSSNLFKYDLLYNPTRFESWQKLANVYDEEVDLLLNDGSKHMSILDWRKNTDLSHRVKTGRRRSRRCLIMSLGLTMTPMQQSQINELLALVYYDCLQNVVPLYDQRTVVPTKDATWTLFCQKSLKHFEKAFALKPEWLHAFYLGKLHEKLQYSADKVFSYYSKAISLNKAAVDPVYRMHASRLKMLYSQGKRNLDVLQAVGLHAFRQSTKDRVLNMLGPVRPGSSTPAIEIESASEVQACVGVDVLDECWLLLYDDCLHAISMCVEGELKHFHKARYKLAQGYYWKGQPGDVERAKEELSFCFKSSRSSFTINMWEIDGTVRKGRRKNPSVGAAKKSLEVSLSESSRKFITCIRKYLLLYLNLLEKTGDLSTLEKAYTYLRTDKRFYLCLGDIVPVALGKYIEVLATVIRNPSIYTTLKALSLEQLLEKMFSIFMEHANLWSDISSLPEVNGPELTESALYGYIHQYILLLEGDIRIECLEGLNEKIRRRFKTPKLSGSNFAKMCKHASLAWCRAILVKLASITSVHDAAADPPPTSPSAIGPVLYVDLQADELLISLPEGCSEFRGLDMNWFETLNRIKNVRIMQAAEADMETAVALLRCTYNFYRDSSCGSSPTGINLYTVLLPPLPMPPPTEGSLPATTVQDVVEVLDLSVPRKLLLWAYALVQGRYLGISSVVKWCEEMKFRTKRGSSATPTVPTSSHPSSTGISPNPGKPMPAGVAGEAEEASSSLLASQDSSDHHCSSGGGGGNGNGGAFADKDLNAA